MAVTWQMPTRPAPSPGARTATRAHATTTSRASMLVRAAPPFAQALSCVSHLVAQAVAQVLSISTDFAYVAMCRKLRHMTYTFRTPLRAKCKAIAESVSEDGQKL